MSNVRLSSRSVIGVLVAAGAALVAAFVLAPAALLNGADGAFQDEGGLRDAVGRGLVEYWRGDGPAFPALLAELVDYWFRWHAIKVLISSLMLVVFALLAVGLWRRYVYGTARHAVPAVAATVFSVSATVMVATGLAGASLGKRRSTDDQRVRFMRRTLSVILALTASLLFAAVAVSVLSAAEPSSALRAVLGLG